MNNYIIVSKRIWNKKNYSNLSKRVFFFKKINQRIINKINPKIIFFIHWSKKISKNIYLKNLCIQFHASDLPKFRGGSPVQNQILSNIKNTKVTAFKVGEGIDAGPICLKKKLSLKNDVNTIFNNIEKKSINMIKILIKKKKINFYNQSGIISKYKRRSKKDSNLHNKNLDNLKKINNFLRANDAKYYPKAFINLGNHILYLSKGRMFNNTIQGKYEIRKK